MSGHLLDGDSDSSHAASAPPLSPQPAAQQHSHSLPQDAELHRSPGNAAPHAPPPPGSPYTPPVRRTRPASPVGGGSPGLPLPCSRSPSPPRLITEERAATRTSRREALGLPVAGTSVAVSATAAEDSLLSLRPRSPQQSTASIRLDLGGRPGTSLMWTQPAREVRIQSSLRELRVPGPLRATLCRLAPPDCCELTVCPNADTRDGDTQQQRDCRSCSARS